MFGKDCSDRLYIKKKKYYYYAYAVESEVPVLESLNNDVINTSIITITWYLVL